MQIHQYLQNCLKYLILRYIVKLEYVGKIIVPDIGEQKNKVSVLVGENVEFSKKDWDSFETSWDFQHHPLLRKVSTIAEAFDQWQEECNDRFNKLKANEEELNRIFIDIYGLQDELTPVGRGQGCHCP